MSQRSIFAMNTEDRTVKHNTRAGVIDMFAHDPKTGEIVLVMNEHDEWNGSDEQLLALQERFNAYVSFLLDGEAVVLESPRDRHDQNLVILRALVDSIEPIRRAGDVTREESKASMGHWAE